MQRRERWTGATGRESDEAVRPPLGAPSSTGSESSPADGLPAARAFCGTSSRIAHGYSPRSAASVAAAVASQRHGAVLRMAALVHAGLESYIGSYAKASVRALSRFECGEARATAPEPSHHPVELRAIIDDTVQEAGLRLGQWSGHDRAVWVAVRRVFLRMIEGTADQEIAETFFNSVTRRLFGVVGLDRELEFVSDLGRRLPIASDSSAFHRFPGAGFDGALLQRILASYPLRIPQEGASHPTLGIVDEVREQLQALGRNPSDIEAVETLVPLFVRDQRAYIVGRMRFVDGAFAPLILGWVQRGETAAVEALWVRAEETAQLFCVARQAFAVDVQNHRDIVHFLASILPRQPVAHLYRVLGLSRHAKRELHLDVMRHLEVSTERFDFAATRCGHVMTVFALPSHGFVFKIIRDRIEGPVAPTQSIVRSQYERGAWGDRSGRLLTAQHFQMLQLPQLHFRGALLAHLRDVAGSCVGVDGDRVVLGNAYLQQRLIPLRVYLRSMDPGRVLAVALDCGNAVRDLAIAGAFPGRLSVHSFGVDPHGRVLVYDRVDPCAWDSPLSADEAARRCPTPSGREALDSLLAEMVSLRGLGGTMRQEFLRVHRELFDDAFWERVQGP